MTSDIAEAVVTGLKEILAPRFRGLVVFHTTGYRDRLTVWSHPGGSGKHLANIYPRSAVVQVTFNMGHFNDLSFDYEDPALVDKIGDALDQYLQYLQKEDSSPRIIVDLLMPMGKL